MSKAVLCIDCEAEENKTNQGVRYVGGGCYSLPMPRHSRCTICSTEAEGFKHCLACVIEKQLCQGCDKPVRANYGDGLRAQVKEARTTLELALAEAAQTFTNAIAPFKDDAAEYEALYAESERQLDRDLDALETDGSKAIYNRHRERQREAADKFSNYEEYRKALSQKERAQEKAGRLFTAGVKRDHGYWSVDRTYAAAVRLAEMCARD